MSENTLLAVVVLAAVLVGCLVGFALAQLRAARIETRLRAAFDSLAGQTLRDNSETFLRMARETLGRDQVIAQASLKERETAIAQLVAPLRAALDKTEAQAHALERERREAFGSLRTQIEALTEGQSLLQRETRNLVTALRRPEVRGRWGELTLRRLVELAGMSPHCDFTEQLHVVGDAGALRPDLVVHMPDSRDLVVDVKTPLDAYLEALEATSEEARAHHLKRHAQHVEARVRQLASKAYWSQFEHSPEFTVLFLPGDQFLAAALAERTDLLETALRQNVIIATPSTLIALLKTVAFGWRQAAVAQNAATIRELGQELYRRLVNFTGHLGRAGARLGAAVEAYNAAVGSLERNVLPQARRFTDLGVTADSPIGALRTVDALARTDVNAGGGQQGAGVGDAARGGADDAGDASPGRSDAGPGGSDAGPGGSNAGQGGNNSGPGGGNAVGTRGSAAVVGGGGYAPDQ